MKHNMQHLSVVLSGALLMSSVSGVFAQETGLAFFEPLDKIITKKSSAIHIDVGIGSGACRLAGDPQGILYTITDRGPNIKTQNAEKYLDVDFGRKKGKIFPVPNFAPAIYKIQIKNDQVKVLEKIQIKNIVGKPVKLSDGTFWIGEEYGPSILHIAADGRVLKHWVPEGVKASLEGAGYEINEKLPGILRARKLNRGIESMTASPDEQYLYFAMQSPLANPDKSAYHKGNAVRIFKVDRQNSRLVGEYVYVLDAPESFVLDNRKKKRKQSDVKVGELTSIDTDKLVVLERISKTTKFYLVDLGKAENILAGKWDDPATHPTLEQVGADSVTTQEKHLLLNTDAEGGLMKKIEGLAWFGKNSWIMVNDNDFGIEGDPTIFAHVSMKTDLD
ncbi:MAG TPA: esterase-like activity of phytase family protein [Desulfobacterales bacterium]|nr:esterase-like activity of phytase family protein [Desulfobacterales bacterium]